MSTKPAFVPVVAVLNMKGGVGKTTLSANLFRVLYERKRLHTLLIDIDPQFNLTQSLFTRDQYDLLKDKGKTILSVMEPAPAVSLFEIKTSALPPPSPEELVKALRFFTHFPAITLDLLAGDFDLVKYSLMDDRKKLDKVRSRFLSFVHSARSKYGLVAIDCNPSSSFLTMCALAACTHVLVPVRPDRYSMLGLEVLWKFVNDIIPLSPKPEFIIALNGVPKGVGGTDVGVVEAELRGHDTFGTRTLGGVVRVSGILAAKADYTGFATDKRVAWSSALKAEISTLADELAKKLGIK